MVKTLLLFLSAVLTVSAAKGQEAFLIDYFGPDGNMYRIGLYSPLPETLIGPCQPFLGDAEFDQDNQLFALSGQGPEFYQIDTTSAVSTYICDIPPQAGHIWTGMAFDPVSGQMYASSTSGSESAFYLLDTVSDTASLIASTTEADAVADIAFDGAGQLYAHNLPNEICLVDKSTGAVTLLGNTGFQAAGPWHGMDFSFENDTMYMATYNSVSMVRSIRTVNLSTGLTTEVGTTSRGAGGFAIVTPPVAVEDQAGPVPQYGNLGIYPNPASGGVSISFGEIAQDARLLITDLAGREVSTLQGDSPVFWSGQGQWGSPVPGGVYLVHLLDQGGIVDSGKVIILR